MNLADLSIQQLMDAIAKGRPPMAPARLPVPQPAPALPEQYRDMSVKDCRQRLMELRDDAVKAASRGRWSDAESMEWAKLPEKHRALLLLMSGFNGGDYEELALAACRAWQEFTPPERNAIKAELRELHQAVQPVSSLRLKD